MTAERVRSLAANAGFELAGITAAGPVPEHTYFLKWVEQGMAGEMKYLTDHRAALRSDPRRLLPSARSIICVGKVYNGPQPYSTSYSSNELAWISRYAWGEDYHDVLRSGLMRLVEAMRRESGCDFEWRICVDTAPVLERALARRAGLGWIGKNTCLINQKVGSWFFLGELLVSLDLEPDAPPPDRCGTCTRCIDACPTKAIVPTETSEGPAWALDSRLCISYLTIELRSAMPAELRDRVGNHVFGCDICQEVCPWNRRAAITSDPVFAPATVAPPLARLAAISEEEFRGMFRRTPVWRAKYRGFLRNVAVAMGNSGDPAMLEPLRKLAAHNDELVAAHARWAIRRIESRAAVQPLQ